MTRRRILPTLAAALLMWAGAGGEAGHLQQDGDQRGRRPRSETQVIASPNPTVRESDDAADAPAPPVTSEKVGPTKATKAAPMKQPRDGERPPEPRED